MNENRIYFHQTVLKNRYKNKRPENFRFYKLHSQLNISIKNKPGKRMCPVMN